MVNPLTAFLLIAFAVAAALVRQGLSVDQNVAALFSLYGVAEVLQQSVTNSATPSFQNKKNARRLSPDVRAVCV